MGGLTKSLALPLLACVFGFALPDRSLQQSPDPRPGALVPAYFYPAGNGMKAWQQLAEAARTIKIEAILNPRVRFGEISIQYSSRLGETKLNAWRDGVQNILFLLKKRFFR